MSNIYFSKDLDKRISYKIPLFIIPLTFNKQPKKGGHDDAKFMFKQIIDYKEMSERFLFLMHKTFVRAILILRHIFLNNDFIYSDLRKYITQDEQINNVVCDSLDKGVLDIFQKVKKHGDIIEFPFWKSENIHATASSLFHQSNSEMIVIKSYNLEEDNSGFLILWGEFIENLQGGKRYFYSNETIQSAMKRAGFKYLNEFTPITTAEKNPGYITYLLFTKSKQ